MILLSTFRSGGEDENKKKITLQTQIISFQKPWHPWPCTPEPGRPARSHRLEGIYWNLFIAGTTLALYMGADSITIRSGHPAGSFHMLILYCFMEHCGCVQDTVEFGIKHYVL